MLVNRRTFIVKKPYFEEALALLVEAGKLMKSTDPNVVFRVYASEIGPCPTQWEKRDDDLRESSGKKQLS